MGQIISPEIKGMWEIGEEYPPLVSHGEKGVPSMNRPSFGIIVGRFQVHELHDGHTELFRIVRGRHNRIIVFLGCNECGPTRHDPLDFETRKKMIQAKFPEFTVLPLKDKKTDEMWSRGLDERINDAVGTVPAEVILYGSRDSFAPFYHGGHKVKELDIEVPASINSTDVRAVLTNTVMESSDFRAGVIYAMGQLFPRTIPCVDIAIIHRGECLYPVGNKPDVNIFLAQKAEDKLWRFVGGHVVITTPSLEADCKKEVMEETGLDVSDLEYVGSLTIQDWRWRSEKSEGIKTALFIANSMTMGGGADDDIANARWFNITEISEEDIEPVHKPLFRMLINHLHYKWEIPLLKDGERNSS